MNILYCHDNMYKEGPDSNVYSQGQFPYSYWGPFLEAFDSLTVSGRGEPLEHDTNIANLNLASGPNVSFELFPNINTIKGRIKHTQKTSDELKDIVARSDGVIIRAVSDIGWLAFKHAKAMKKPIALEMAACAWDSTWNHGNKLGKIYAPVRFWRDKQIARHADYVLYVSQDFLQNRYPTNGETTIASNVRVDPTSQDILEERLEHIKNTQNEKRPHVIGLIGNINNRIKGLEDALHAMKIVNDHKPGSFIFRQLGPGNQGVYREQLKSLGIESVVHFDGMVKSDGGVFNWLDEIDLYIQPSYQEGVPRAMIEAMSRGCPVIGSTAGGIPELIPREWQHKPGDYQTLAQLILKMLGDPESEILAANENFMKSQCYTSEKLMPKRLAFWKSFADFIRA